METAVQIFDEIGYSIPETAKELRLSVDTIGRWLRVGGIFPNAYKSGPFVQSTWVIPQSDIDSFKTRMTGKANSSASDAACPYCAEQFQEVRDLAKHLMYEHDA